MALKKFNPRTPGQRQLVIVDRSDLWKGKPVKTLTEGLSKTGGRNNVGRMTARHRGGGHKRTYRLVDFKRRKTDVEAVVERIEYDPNDMAANSICALLETLRANQCWERRLLVHRLKRSAPTSLRNQRPPGYLKGSRRLQPYVSSNQLNLNQSVGR